jgi:hypothetical protein
MRHTNSNHFPDGTAFKTSQPETKARVRVS